MKNSHISFAVTSVLLGMGFSTTIAFSQSPSMTASNILSGSRSNSQLGDQTVLFSLSRRDLLTAISGCTCMSMTGKAVADEGKELREPLADLPMVRLSLPQGGFGREYVALKLKIKGEGPFDFMVDTGLTTEFITPHLQQTLGIGKNAASSKIKGLAAGGATVANDLVEFKDASLCCGNIFGANELPLPTLHAIITDFPQEHIDPAHDPVEGMLGMEMLSLFDVDFDFPAGRIRFWRPGTAAQAATGLVAIPAVVINETGLIGIRLSTPGMTQPVLAFLDCGSTFSLLNWQAAKLLGLPDKHDSSYKGNPTITAIGIDGRVLQLPTAKKALTFTGDTMEDPSTGRPIGFQAPPSNWKPWSTVQVAVGDLPVFTSALGDGIHPFTGPAALIGLDVLAQRRVIFETGLGRTRRRRILVSPS
jgi:hypothetical protein